MTYEEAMNDQKRMVKYRERQCKSCLKAHYAASNQVSTRDTFYPEFVDRNVNRAYF